VTTTTEFARSTPNLAGGDVIGGSNGGLQVLLRPRPAIDPYATGLDGVYLCSASTPPGPGVHGLGGWYAAKRVLREFGITRLPSVAPEVLSRAGSGPASSPPAR
jgi:phytoene dehydrogenase-like protein